MKWNDPRVQAQIREIWTTKQLEDPRIQAIWEKRDPPTNWKVKGFYEHGGKDHSRATFILSRGDEHQKLRMDLLFDDPVKLAFQGELYLEPKGKSTSLPRPPSSSPPSDSSHTFMIKGEYSPAGQMSNGSWWYQGTFEIEEQSGKGSFEGIRGGGMLPSMASKQQLGGDVDPLEAEGHCVFDIKNYPVGYTILCPEKMSSSGKKTVMGNPYLYL
ncbi:MAG: hypothetical protein Q9223_004184 [Gallowayella weberi]